MMLAVFIGACRVSCVGSLPCVLRPQHCSDRLDVGIASNS